MSSRWSTWPVTRRTWWCPTTSSTALWGPWATGEPSRSSAAASWTTNVNGLACGSKSVLVFYPHASAVSLCALMFPHSGIRLLVWTRAGILGTPHGLKRPLPEVWRHVQGGHLTFSYLHGTWVSSCLRTSVISHLVHPKLMQLILPSIWHWGLRIYRESHSHNTSPSHRRPSWAKLSSRSI